MTQPIGPGRPSQLDEAKVFAAADDLMSDAKPVNVRTVRERLGYGGYPKIGEYLDAWKQQRAAETQTLPDVPADVAQKFDQIWQAAARAAHQQYAADRAALDALKQEFEEEKGHLREEIARLEQTLEVEIDRRQSAETEAEEQAKAHQQDQKDLAAQQLDLTRTNEQLTAAQQRAADTERQLEQVREQRQADRTAFDGHRQRYDQDVRTLREQNTELEKTLSAESARRQRAEAEAENHAATSRTLQAQAGTLQADLARAKERLAAVQQRADDVEQQAVAAREQLDGVLQRLGRMPPAEGATAAGKTKTPTRKK